MATAILLFTIAAILWLMWKAMEQIFYAIDRYHEKQRRKGNAAVQTSQVRREAHDRREGSVIFDG